MSRDYVTVAACFLSAMPLRVNGLSFDSPLEISPLCDKLQFVTAHGSLAPVWRSCQWPSNKSCIYARMKALIFSIVTLY